MAKNSSVSKRGARSARQEARLLQEQQQREKEAKERKTQTIIGATVFGVIVILVAIVIFTIVNSINNNPSAEKLFDAVQKVEVKPSVANTKGGIVVSKLGIGQDKKVPNVPTVAVYMDPICPGCADLERQTGETFMKLVEAGQINLEVYPLGFLDLASTDNYSTRTSSVLYYLAQHDKNSERFLKFVAGMYDPKFQPEEGSGYRSVSDDKLKQLAISVGVPENIADKAVSGTYSAYVKALSSYTPSRKELWNTTGQFRGQMTTPTITVNSHFLNIDQIAQSGVTKPAAILQAIGLDQANVGAAGQLPRIGAQGKPAAFNG